MHPVLASCRLFLEILKGLVAALQSGTLRPDRAPAPAARRLAAGLRLAEAYLRRVLLVMALELEPSLTDAPRPMRRPHGRRAQARSRRFKVLGGPFTPLSEDARHALAQARLRQQDLAQPGSRSAALDRLSRRLEVLAAIAADPVVRARRLAFHLARRLPGPLQAPDQNLRPGRWTTTEARITFELMACEILARSRSRPPAPPPPRRHGPSVTVMDG